MKKRLAETAEPDGVTTISGVNFNEAGIWFKDAEKFIKYKPQVYKKQGDG
ncbi:hypothetical protein ACH518_14025 [Methylomonas sp. HW2-6]|nr:hypothetical protein [Methylomonas koyamae]